MLRNGVGNFGTFGIFDRILSTTIVEDGDNGREEEESQRERGRTEDDDDEVQLVASRAVKRRTETASILSARGSESRPRPRPRERHIREDGDGDDEVVEIVGIDRRVREKRRQNSGAISTAKERIAAKSNNAVLVNTQGTAPMKKNRANRVPFGKVNERDAKRKSRSRPCGYDGYAYDYEWHPGHDC